MYARLSVSFCCTKCLIAQKFQSLSAIMASQLCEGSECVSSNDQLISTFLKFAWRSLRHYLKGSGCINLTI